MDDTLTLSQLIEALMDLQNRCSPHTPTGVHSTRFEPCAPRGQVVLDTGTAANYDRAIELLQEAEEALDPNAAHTRSELDATHEAIKAFLDS